MNKSALRDEQFPVTKNFIYLNHAAVGPLSSRAYDAMERHARDQRDAGAAHWKEWYAEHDAVRASAASLINALPGEISILKNTSEGLSFVAAGLDWREGDNLITTDLEFPSNFSPWQRLEKRGVECRVVRSREGAYDVSAVEALMDARTRLVSVSSVAFHNGFAPDLLEIGRLCRMKNVLFCVDAIQSLGVIPIDVRAANISFLASDGHKWLLAPEGAAIFFCAEAARERVEVTEVGWMNVDRRGKFIGCSTDLLADGRRFEAGSLNTNGIYGLRASLDLIMEIGVEAIQIEVLRLANRLADGLEGLGFGLGGPRPLRSGIVGAIPRSVDFNRLECAIDAAPKSSRDLRAVVGNLHHLLERRKIITAPREGLVRFSPHFYNSDEEIDLALDVLRTVSGTSAASHAVQTSV